MMADPIQNAPPTTDVPQTPGAPLEDSIPGTNLNLPEGGGVERVIAVGAPYQNNAPPWYSPKGTVWALVGCAVPQPGSELQTNNLVIWAFNNIAGKQLFNLLWSYAPDRLSDNKPTYDCMWAMYELLINARNKLTGKVVADAQSATRPTKATPAPKMFLCYPVPFYGPLGCTNSFMNFYAETIMLMQEEALQHEDNLKAFFITKDFFDATYPAIKYLLVDMATQFFGVDQATASKDDYVIPDPAWQAYSRDEAGGSFGATAQKAPLPYVYASPSDLSKIRGLPYEYVVPFLQPWPDAQYKMSSGGIWANSSSPGIDPTAKAGAAATGVSSAAGGANLAATADPSIFKTNGPPQP